MFPLCWINIRKHRRGTGRRNTACGRDKRRGGDYHLVTGSQSESAESDLKGNGSVSQGYPVAHGSGGSKFVLEKAALVSGPVVNATAGQYCTGGLNLIILKTRPSGKT